MLRAWLEKEALPTRVRVLFVGLNAITFKERQY